MRVAFLISHSIPYQSLIQPWKIATTLKKQGYDTCITFDYDLSSAVFWNKLLTKEGINAIPGLIESDRYFIPKSINGFYNLVRYINGVTSKPGSVIILKGKPLNTGDEKAIPIWESRYTEKNQSDLLNVYRKLGDFEELTGDYSLPTKNHYEMNLKEKIDKLVGFLPETFYLKPHEHLFPVQGTSEELKRLALTGLKSMNKYTNQNYIKRLNYEIEIISSKNFQDYFLTVSEVVRKASEINCLIGPGRGSAVGSLLVRTLGITAVDPLEHELYFERFMSRNRKDFPDIDLDVEDTKRQDLLKFLAKTFGKEHVTLIQTFGTFSFRSAAKSLGRLYKTSEKDIEHLISWSKEGKRLPYAFQKNSTIRKIFVQSNLLAGLYTNPSIHAAGIILSKRNLKELIPLREHNGIYVSLWDMNSLNSMGYQKLDILGLKNLSIIKKLAKNDISWKKKPDDEKTYNILSRGMTTGIFQLEGKEATKITKNIALKNIKDLSIAIALNRPGPMSTGIVKEFFIRTRNLSAGIKSPQELPGLEDTMGLLIFQEQVIKVAAESLNLTPEDGELLRRSLSKKDPKKLEEVLSRAKIENSEKLVGFLKKFAGYSFNKSHSIGYATISYWLSYFKANEPANFYKTIIPSLSINNRIRAAAEARSSGIEIILSNESYRNKIAFMPGDFRKSLEPFSEFPKDSSFYDFVRKNRKYLTGKDLEFLINIGYLDKFGARKKLLKEINNAIAGIDPTLKSVLQVFGYKNEGNVANTEDSVDERAATETQTLGFNLTRPMFPKEENVYSDMSLTDIISTLSSGLAAYRLLKYNSGFFITDGTITIPVESKPPEKGYLLLKNGEIKSAKFYDNKEITKVVRKVHGPVSARNIVNTDPGNILEMEFEGKSLNINGAKLKGIEPDEIIIGGQQ